MKTYAIATIPGDGIGKAATLFGSVVMIMERLGEDDPAKRAMRGMERITASLGLLTNDLGSPATTAEVTRTMCDLLGANYA